MFGVQLTVQESQLLGRESRMQGIQFVLLLFVASDGPVT